MINVCQRLARDFPAPTAEISGTERPITTWYVKAGRLQATPVLLFINSRSLMPIVIPGPSFLTVEPNLVFTEVLSLTLAGFQFPATKVKRYLNQVNANIALVPDVTTNFTLERVARECFRRLADFSGALMDEDNQQRLLENFTQVSVYLAKGIAEVVPQPPLMVLADAIMVEFRLPASMERPTAFRQRYAELEDLADIEPRTPACKAAQQRIAVVNNDLLAAFADFMKEEGVAEDQQETNTTVVSSYLNQYLLIPHPLTPVSDLTMAGDFLMNGPFATEKARAVGAVAAMREFGAFARQELWVASDQTLFDEGIANAEQVLAKRFKGTTGANQKQLDQLLTSIMQLTPEALGVAIQHLAPDLRQKLAQVVKDALAATDDDQDDQ